MALIKCRECGNDMSDKAKLCPNCGAQNSIMFCPECGKELSVKALYCPDCGYRFQEIRNTSGNSDKIYTFALVGMILGFCSIIAWLLPFLGYPTAITGIVFSSLGMKSNLKRGMAITGLVLSIVFLCLTFVNSCAGALGAYY